MPNKYEIKIQTVSDPSGAQQTAKELDNVAKAAKPAAEAIKQEGDEVEKAATKKSKLLDATKKLTHALPELGTVVSALKNPFTLLTFAIGAVVAVFTKFKDEVMQAEQAMRGFDSANLTVRTFFELIAKHNADSKAFALSLNEIASRAGTAAERLQAMNAAIERRFGALRELGELQKQAELNQVAEDEGAGRIKPAEAITRRTQIELKYRGALRRGAEKEQQAKLEALQKAQGIAVQQQAGIFGELAEAEPAAIRAEQYARRTSGLTTPQLADIARRRAGLEEIIKQGPPAPFIPGTKVHLISDVEDLKRFQEAPKGLEQLKKEEDMVKALQVQVDARAKAAQDRVSRLQERARTGEEGIRGLGLGIQEQQQAISDVRGFNQRAGPIEERVIRGGGAAQIAAEQKRLNEELARQLLELNKNTTQFGVNMTTLIQILRRIGLTQAQVDKALSELKGREMKDALKP